MKRFFHLQLAEILSSKSLKIYGVFLALSHLLTVMFWQDRIVGYLNDPICWPAIPFCETLGSVLQFWSGWIWGLYALLSLVTLGFWLTKKWRWAYGFLLLETLLKIFILSLSYQFRGNYHYMMILVCLQFLLVPGKIWGLHGLLILFYFFAGTLKPNQEWISGSALLTPLNLPEPWFTLGFVGVAFLELSLVWLLLSKNNRIFWAVFFGFLFFHAASWPLVRYYFPLTMTCLISLIPLYRIFENPQGPLVNFNWKAIPRATWVSLILFCGIQLVPLLKAGDTTLTGEGRIFRLNMLDAYTDCDSFGSANFDKKTLELNFNNQALPVRIHCDPIFFHHRLRQKCEQLKDQKGFRDISFSLLSRKKTDLGWTQVIHQANYCSQNFSMSTFPVNSWIQGLPKPFRFSDQMIWPASVNYGLDSGNANQDLIYVAAPNGRVSKINKNSGRVQWVIDLGNAQSVEVLAQGETVIATVRTFETQGFLARLVPETGEVIWISPWLRDLEPAAPMIKDKKSLVYVRHSGQRFSAVELETGEPVWEFNAPEP